jgi:hypothetical protein
VPSWIGVVRKEANERVNPTQRLKQIGDYAEHLLLSLGTEYVRIGAPKIPNTVESPLSREWEAQCLVNAMRYLAFITALLEGAADEREALRQREEIVIRYIEEARRDADSHGE